MECRSFRSTCKLSTSYPGQNNCGQTFQAIYGNGKQYASLEELDALKSKNCKNIYLRILNYFLSMKYRIEENFINKGRLLLITLKEC